VKHEERALKQ